MLGHRTPGPGTFIALEERATPAMGLSILAPESKSSNPSLLLSTLDTRPRVRRSAHRGRTRGLSHRFGERTISWDAWALIH